MNEQTTTILDSLFLSI